MSLYNMIIFIWCIMVTIFQIKSLTYENGLMTRKLNHKAYLYNDYTGVGSETSFIYYHDYIKIKFKTIGDLKFIQQLCARDYLIVSLTNKRNCENHTVLGTFTKFWIKEELKFETKNSKKYSGKYMTKETVMFTVSNIYPHDSSFYFLLTLSNDDTDFVPFYKTNYVITHITEPIVPSEIQVYDNKKNVEISKDRIDKDGCVLFSIYNMEVIKIVCRAEGYPVPVIIMKQESKVLTISNSHGTERLENKSMILASSSYLTTDKALHITCHTSYKYEAYDRSHNGPVKCIKINASSTITNVKIIFAILGGIFLILAIAVAIKYLKCGMNNLTDEKKKHQDILKNKEGKKKGKKKPKEFQTDIDHMKKHYDKEKKKVKIQAYEVPYSDDTKKKERELKKVQKHYGKYEKKETKQKTKKKAGSDDSDSDNRDKGKKKKKTKNKKSKKHQRSSDDSDSGHSKKGRSRKRHKPRMTFSEEMYKLYGDYNHMDYGTHKKSRRKRKASASS